MNGFMCGNRIYKYKGWTFEYGMSIGVWPLKQNGEPRKRAGRVFYKIIDQWCKEKDKEKFRVGGGCIPIGGK